MNIQSIYLDFVATLFVLPSHFVFIPQSVFPAAEDLSAADVGGDDHRVSRGRRLEFRYLKSLG